jgi:hypothetical protein
LGCDRPRSAWLKGECFQGDDDESTHLGEREEGVVENIGGAGDDWVVASVVSRVGILGMLWSPLPTVVTLSTLMGPGVRLRPSTRSLET